MMNAKQALVTCGGNGSRLREAGLEFFQSKSFIELEGKPVFHWCLLGLYYSGIEKLVVAGETPEKLTRAEKVLSNTPFTFLHVDFYQDPGLGPVGLPYQARHLLDSHFFFEYGHNMSKPEHYQLLDELDSDKGIVVSGFKPNPCTPRSYVRLDSQKMASACSLTGRSDEFSVGPPMLLNHEYIARLPDLGFKLQKVVEFYASCNSLKLVPSKMPLEADVIDEWNDAVPAYRNHIERLRGFQ